MLILGLLIGFGLGFVLHILFIKVGLGLGIDLIYVQYLGDSMKFKKLKYYHTRSKSWCKSYFRSKSWFESTYWARSRFWSKSKSWSWSKSISTSWSISLSKPWSWIKFRISFFKIIGRYI